MEGLQTVGYRGMHTCFGVSEWTGFTWKGFRQPVTGACTLALASESPELGLIAPPPRKKKGGWQGAAERGWAGLGWPQLCSRRLRLPGGLREGRRIPGSFEDKVRASEIQVSWQL